MRSAGTPRLMVLGLSLLVKLARSAPLCAMGGFDVAHQALESDSPDDDDSAVMFRAVMSAILVLLGGIFAGLTIGLMGQDEVYLQVTAETGDESERKAASKVLRLLSRGKHWVLVTLLLSNVITNETLPIVLDRLLGGGWPAVVSSTAAIVIFGEIIPQSIAVRYGLRLGAYFAPFVQLLMYLMYPLAVPIARLLDFVLGEDHGTIYKKAGLKSLVTIHHHMGIERLNEDEVTIISAVLDLKDKPVSQIMTPINDVFVLSSSTRLDEAMVEKILLTGFNRIPIHIPGEPLNFIGMLLVRTLITYDPEDALPISSFALATLPETSPETSCLNILNYFQEGKSHMVAVSTDPGQADGAVGVVTLEDVIEELIGEEIVDESDVYVDVHRAIRRVAPAPMLRHTVNPPKFTALRPSNRASDPLQTLNSKITIKRKQDVSGTLSSPIETSGPRSAGSSRYTDDPEEREDRNTMTLSRLARSPGNFVTKVPPSQQHSQESSIQNSTAGPSDRGSEGASATPSASGSRLNVDDADSGSNGYKKTEVFDERTAIEKNLGNSIASLRDRKNNKGPRELEDQPLSSLKGSMPSASSLKGIPQKQPQQPQVDDEEARSATFSENVVRVNGVNKVIIEEISSSSEDNSES